METKTSPLTVIGIILGILIVIFLVWPKNKEVTQNEQTLQTEENPTPENSDEPIITEPEVIPENPEFPTTGF